MKRRDALWVVLGVALSAWVLGFTASPALALSITGTYTDIANGSPGTTGPLTGLVTGLVGPSGASLVGGFPNVSTLGNNFWSTTLGTGVTADGFGTRVDNSAGLSLNFSSFFGQGLADDSAKYLASHWTAAFSNATPVTFSLSADDHAFLFIDGKLVLDDGGVKPIGSSVTTAFSSTGNHALDLFFADVHVSQSGIIFSCDGCLDPTSNGGNGSDGADPASAAPEPTTLLLFGTTLVGLGAIVRRRMRRATKTTV